MLSNFRRVFTFKPNKKGVYKAKAFTILEISIVAVLLSILLLILLRWISGLSSAGSAGVSASASSRELTFAIEQIRRDINRAEGCDPMSLDVPVHYVKVNEIALYVPNNSFGKDLVIWRVSDDTVEGEYVLEKALIEDSGACLFDTTNPIFEPVLENVLYSSESSDNPIFSVIDSGLAVSDDTVYKDCYLNYEECIFDKVKISLKVIGAGGEGTIAESSAVVDVNLSGSRLTLLS